MTNERRKQICKELDKEFATLIKQARDVIKQAQEARKSLKSDGLSFNKLLHLENYPETAHLYWTCKKIGERQTQIEAEYRKTTGKLPDFGWL